MGNKLEFCEGCKDGEAGEESLKLKQSACVEFIDNLPKIKGKFNFEKQTSFNKIERAASEYCQNNYIQKTHVHIIARLLAYQQNHYFDVIKQLPTNYREQFVSNQEHIDIELMDSLYHYFVIQNNKKLKTDLFIGNEEIKKAPTIDIEQISEDNRQDLTCEGIKLIRTGKVALVIMAAGKAENTSKTSKVLTPLPLPGEPTSIELIMRRYVIYLGVNNLNPSQQTNRRKKQIITPIIVICSQKNYVGVREIFFRNHHFGLQQNYIKIVVQTTTVPLIDRNGKLCISFEEKTLVHPSGTAASVAKIIDSKLKSFLECCLTQYIHFIGCENITEMPGDPLLLGLIHKFQRKVAGKCVKPTSLYQKYPRYVSTTSAFHLLDLNELNSLGNIGLMIDSPLALNSMIFRLSSLFQIYHNYEFNLYLAKRFHMYEVKVNYYDFQQLKPIMNEKVFGFQQDIRDYINASRQTIVVKYRQEHFKPILSTDPDDLQQLCEQYKEPLLY